MQVYYMDGHASIYPCLLCICSLLIVQREQKSKDDQNNTAQSARVDDDCRLFTNQPPAWQLLDRLKL